MSESLHVVALAQAPEGDALPEFPVIYTGEFEHGGRKVSVTEADLDEAIANFNAQLAAGTEIPVDYEHGQAEGGIAAGWYKALRREGNRLLAKVAWTDKAKEQIRTQARKYFSPEFTPAAKDEHGNRVGFKLLAGALVVRPHLKGLGAVAFTDDAVKSLAQDALRAAPLTQFPSPAPTPKDSPDMADTVALKDFEAVQTQLSEAAEKITALSERVTAAEERADSAEAKFEASEKRLFEAELSRTLDKARREGRIDAKDETTAKWTERAEKHGVEFVAELLADIPAETIPMSEQGHGKDKPQATDVPDGVDPDSYRVHMRAEQIAAEKDIPYEQAAALAFSEVQS